jgi:hypothetical protein
MAIASHGPQPGRHRFPASGCLQMPGVLGIIFGFIGLKQTKDNARKGRGMAIAGLVIGIILTVACHRAVGLHQHQRATACATAVTGCAPATESTGSLRPRVAATRWPPPPRPRSSRLQHPHAGLAPVRLAHDDAASTLERLPWCRGSRRRGCTAVLPSGSGAEQCQRTFEAHLLTEPIIFTQSAGVARTASGCDGLQAAFRYGLLTSSPVVSRARQPRQRVGLPATLLGERAQAVVAAPLLPAPRLRVADEVQHQTASRVAFMWRAAQLPQHHAGRRRSCRSRSPTARC